MLGPENTRTYIWVQSKTILTHIKFGGFCVQIGQDLNGFTVLPCFPVVFWIHYSFSWSIWGLDLLLDGWLYERRFRLIDFPYLHFWVSIKPPVMSNSCPKRNQPFEFPRFFLNGKGFRIAGHTVMIFFPFSPPQWGRCPVRPCISKWPGFWWPLRRTVPCETSQGGNNDGQFDGWTELKMDWKQMMLQNMVQAKRDQLC